MRTILKDGDNYELAYWVTFDGKAVLGCPGDMLKRQIGIPDKYEFEHHFHYPDDGKHHHTVNVKGKEIEWFLQVYHDKIKFKKIINPYTPQKKIVKREFPRLAFHRDNDMSSVALKILDHLDSYVHIYQNEPLSQVSNLWTNITMVVPIIQGRFLLRHLIPNYKPSADEIVIDASKYQNAVLTIGTYLQPNVRPLLYANHPRAQVLSTPINENVALSMYAVIDADKAI